MTIKELYELAKLLEAENAEIKIDAYDDTDTYCGDTDRINANFCNEDGKDIVYLEQKGA